MLTGLQLKTVDDAVRILIFTPLQVPLHLLGVEHLKAITLILEALVKFLQVLNIFVDRLGLGLLNSEGTVGTQPYSGLRQVLDVTTKSERIEDLRQTQSLDRLWEEGLNPLVLVCVFALAFKSFFVV